MVKGRVSLESRGTVRMFVAFVAMVAALHWMILGGVTAHAGRVRLAGVDSALISRQTTTKLYFEIYSLALAIVSPFRLRD